MYHEWRNGARPYRVGPSLHISEGVLSVTKPDGEARVLAQVPADEWLEVEARAALGEASDGTWSLKLHYADGTDRAWTDLPVVHGDWKSLTWVGFCSDGVKPTTWYLDDLSLRREGSR
jgi:hypothetical protein